MSFSFRPHALSFALVVLATCFASNLAANPLEQARELYASGNWDTAKEAYENALKTDATKADAALGLAGIYWEQGNYSKAISWIDKAETLASKGKRIDLMGQIEFTRGHIYASQGRFDKAAKSLAKCKKSKDPNFVILCRISTRFLRQVRGKSVSSKVAYQKDLKKLEATGEPLLVATALARAAELRDTTGASTDAIALLKQAGAHYKKADSLPAATRNKLRLAAVYQNAGQWAASKKALNGVVSTFANMNNRPALVTSYTLLGQQAQHEGDGAKALKYFQKARKTSKGINSPQLIAQVDLGLCALHSKNKHLSKSRSHCGAAFTKFSSIKAWSLAARSKILFAGVAQERRELAESQKAYREAIEILANKIAPGSVRKRDIALQNANLCQVESQLKSTTSMKTCKRANAMFGGFAKDVEIYNAMGATEYALATLSIGKVARAHFEAAAGAFEKANRPIRIADARLRAGKLEKDPKRAIAHYRKAITFVEKDTTPAGSGVRLQLRMQIVQSMVDAKSWAESESHVDALVEESKNQKDFKTLAWALSARAKIQFKLGNRERAKSDLAQCVKVSKKALDSEQQAICKENLKKLK